MIWLIVFVVMLLVVAGMAIGVMNGRKPISGSCGGTRVMVRVRKIAGASFHGTTPSALLP